MDPSQKLIRRLAATRNMQSRSWTETAAINESTRQFADTNAHDEESRISASRAWKDGSITVTISDRGGQYACDRRHRMLAIVQRLVLYLNRRRPSFGEALAGATETLRLFNRSHDGPGFWTSFGLQAADSSTMKLDLLLLRHALRSGLSMSETMTSCPGKDRCGYCDSPTRIWAPHIPSASDMGLLDKWCSRCELFGHDIADCVRIINCAHHGGDHIESTCCDVEHLPATGISRTSGRRQCQPSHPSHAVARTEYEASSQQINIIISSNNCHKS
ncbi:hypothetical protein CDD80_1917 [Ophiocordyceps camponoti-rufipedis]|uniref:Uncharacterized protein n=1 Tax=Ophiocordyceps camponoti-rufipedis TaxID=2004952 RepID=A0A2C5Z297_9HYPO|nr:hypothetical protein CDD80_1917 [Ophiocordyceps camponoti-rufipedis]